MRFATIFKTFAFVAAFGLFAASCDDDDNGIEFIDYSIKVNLPEDLKDVNPSGLKVTLTNVDTDVKTSLSTDSEGKVSFTGLQGVYNIEVTGTKTYDFVWGIGTNGKDSIASNKVDLAGQRQNIPFTKNSLSQTIDASIVIASKGWVIKELYTAGTRTTEGKSYFYDQFVEIYNNTDSVMYADGISIGETYTNTGQVNFYGNDIEKKTFLHAVYTIEGDGNDWPVQPGKSIVIAPQPIDHAASNSLNLASPVSDFQWFDNVSGQSIDVVEVPNLGKYYLDMKSAWIVTIQMNKGFVIFRAPKGKSMTDFVTENMDTRPNNAGKDMTMVGIPNDCILDGIELGQIGKLYYKSLHASIDIGFMYREESNNGKSIRRRIDHIADDGRIVYKDTNNSSLDFWAGKTPQPKKYPTNDEKDN